MREWSTREDNMREIVAYKCSYGLLNRDFEYFVKDCWRTRISNLTFWLAFLLDDYLSLLVFIDWLGLRFWLLTGIVAYQKKKKKNCWLELLFVFLSSV